MAAIGAVSKAAAIANEEIRDLAKGLKCMWLSGNGRPDYQRAPKTGPHLDTV
jgi:hypothetical protein